MVNEKEILGVIYDRIFKRDVDYSINIFLCGAETNKKDSIRNLLNIEFQKDVKFNTVFPEYIFARLLGKGSHNLFELEDDLAKYVDVIVLPLEGSGTLCELGAFAMNKDLLPKLIAINNEKYSKKKSFINLGPIDLIKKNNAKNIIYYEEGKEKDIIPDLINKIRSKRWDKKPTYDLENLFNLSKFVFYLISVFQPITRERINSLLNTIDKVNVKTKYLDSALQILIQKNRIETDIESKSLKEYYKLSKDGHKYFYEEVITKLKIKNDFTKIRALLINEKYKRKKDMSKDLKLLV